MALADNRKRRRKGPVATDEERVATSVPLRDLYRCMVRIRAFEEKVKDCYTAGLIRGLVHLSIGQEAVAAGVCAHLRPQDWIVSTHRCHGHYLAKGLDPASMMAELFGRRTGCCRGRGGSMHMGDLSRGIIGGNGIVGAGLPLAVGAALSASVGGTDEVAVAFFGDGASNQGTFHEALNLASVLHLPAVFVCENNLYAVSVPQSRHMAVPHVADRAAAYGMPGAVVDGNDACAVYKAAGAAIARARAGDGPFLLECKTYRWRGHGESDASGGSRYRPAEEIAAWRERCPLARTEAALLAQGGCSEKKLACIRSEAAAEMEKATAFAEESPWPTAEELSAFVFVSTEGRRGDSP